MSISVTLYFHATCFRALIPMKKVFFFSPFLFYCCLSRMGKWGVSGNIGIDCLTRKHTWLPVSDLLKFRKHFFARTKTIVLFVLRASIGASCLQCKFVLWPREVEIKIFLRFNSKTLKRLNRLISHRLYELYFSWLFYSLRTKSRNLSDKTARNCYPCKTC